MNKFGNRSISGYVVFKVAVQKKGSVVNQKSSDKSDKGYISRAQSCCAKKWFSGESKKQ